MITDSYLKAAILSDPKGKICFFCGKENDFYDDCGFFYISPDENTKSKPTCYECYYGEPGRKHVEKYGVGER